MPLKGEWSCRIPPSVRFHVNWSQGTLSHPLVFFCSFFWSPRSCFFLLRGLVFFCSLTFNKKKQKAIELVGLRSKGGPPQKRIAPTKVQLFTSHRLHPSDSSIKDFGGSPDHSSTNICKSMHPYIHASMHPYIHASLCTHTSAHPCIHSCIHGSMHPSSCLCSPTIAEILSP